MSHRDFPIHPSQAEPPTFTLADQDFKALPEPPGGALSDYFWTFTNSIEVKAAGLVRFISDCLPDEVPEADVKLGYGGVKEFDEIIHSKTRIVRLSLLHEIVEWLVEEYATRPTTPSSGSVSGSAATPVTSGDGADSVASTQAALVS